MSTRGGRACAPWRRCAPLPSITCHFHDFRVGYYATRAAVLNFEEEFNGLPAPALGRCYFPLVNFH